ncbi:MAG: MarR family transcriptional regulator [Spirochaetia bacterium]|nr:MarR family transcriptional regulator [Spirochaetia bacterium]
MNNYSREDDRDILIVSMRKMSMLARKVGQMENNGRNAGQDASALSERQTEVLTLISELPVPPTLGRLSSLLGTSHQNLRIMLNNLESKGLIAFSTDNMDKRKLRISLTGKGNKTIKELRIASQSIFDNLLRQLSSDEIANFAFLMRKIGNILDHQ